MKFFTIVILFLSVQCFGQKLLKSDSLLTFKDGTYYLNEEPFSGVVKQSFFAQPRMRESEKSLFSNATLFEANYDKGILQSVVAFSGNCGGVRQGKTTKVNLEKVPTDSLWYYCSPGEQSTTIIFFGPNNTLLHSKSPGIALMTVYGEDATKRNVPGSLRDFQGHYMILDMFDEPLWKSETQPLGPMVNINRTTFESINKRGNVWFVGFYEDEWKEDIAEQGRATITLDKTAPTVEEKFLWESYETVDDMISGARFFFYEGDLSSALYVVNWGLRLSPENLNLKLIHWMIMTKGGFNFPPKYACLHY